MQLVQAALCGTEGAHHNGPCAIAWTARLTDSASLVDEEFIAEDLHDLREELEAVEILPTNAVDRYLGL